MKNSTTQMKKNWKICPIDNKSLNELIKGTIAKLSEDCVTQKILEQKFPAMKKSSEAFV